MNQPRQTRYGSLDCYVVDLDQDRPPSALVVLCHGYGAPGSDLVGIIGEWAHLLGDAASSFRFLCPVAPHSLAEQGMPTGRAWWPLNMARMMQAIQAKRFDEMHRERPAGIDEARETLSELINLARQELADQSRCSRDDVPLALGGFSQGAMLTMDTALRGSIAPPDYLIQFSGTLICQAQWTSAIARLDNTRVYQSHGTVDPILPFSSATRLRDLLAAAGVDAQFHSFVGPHTIDGESIASTAVGLRKLVN